MIMGTEADEVSNYLRIKGIIIPPNNYWLTSCVECFKEQGSYNLKQLKELVYQQWLLADLSDIAVPVLPDTCLSNERIVLQGRYAVQFNSFVNIAVSFHKQLQKIRRPEATKNLEVDCENTSNIREVVRGSRTLKFEITDGVITVIGFEDHFIPVFQEPLVPGKKVILVGPIECRKGILFLRSSNIQVLGGEVDALHISNAPENILARALKLPENPDPYHLCTVAEDNIQNDDTQGNSDNGFDDDDEAMMMLADHIEHKVSSDETNSKINHLNNQSRNSTQTYNNLSIKINGKLSETQKLIIPTEVPNKQLNTSSDHLIIGDDFDDDLAQLEQKVNFDKRTESIKFDDDFELLEEQTSLTETSHRNSTPRSIDDSATKMTECQVFDTASTEKQYEQLTELRKKLNESYGTTRLQPSTSGSNNFFTAKSPRNSLKKEKIIVDYLSEAESPLINLTCEPEMNDVTSSFTCDVDDSDTKFFSSDPFPPKKRPAFVKAPARVVKMLKKPKLIGDKWSVTAVVAARGIELEVTFASDVIDKIFTISAAEIISRRTEFISDPVLKQKTNETLRNSQMRLSSLACLMVFSFKDAISKPVVVDIE